MTDVRTGAEGSPAGAARYSLELRAEVMKVLSASDAVRVGESDRVAVGDANGTDRVRGTETLRVGGNLTERVGGSLMTRALRRETRVKGRLTMKCANDNVILGGAMTQTQVGPEFVATGMSDNMIVGGGARVTVGADLWLCGLAGMEEKIGTAAFDGALVELFATAFEREYGPGLHNAGAVSFSGTVHATTAAGFRPLFKVMRGVRNLTSGGGGGGGAEGAAPAPPPSGAGSAAGGLVATADAGAGAGESAARADDVADMSQLAAFARSTEALEDGTGVEDLANTLEDVQAVARGGDVDAGSADNLVDAARAGDVDEGATGASRRHRPVELASPSDAADFKTRQRAHWAEMDAANDSNSWIEKTRFFLQDQKKRRRRAKQAKRIAREIMRGGVRADDAVDTVEDATTAATTVARTVDAPEDATTAAATVARTADAPEDTVVRLLGDAAEPLPTRELPDDSLFPATPEEFRDRFHEVMSKRPDMLTSRTILEDNQYPPSVERMARAQADAHNAVEEIVGRVDPGWNLSGNLHLNRRLEGESYTARIGIAQTNTEFGLRRLQMLLDDATDAGDLQRAAELRTAIDDVYSETYRILYEGALEAEDIHTTALAAGPPPGVDVDRAAREIDALMAFKDDELRRLGDTGNIFSEGGESQETLTRQLTALTYFKGDMLDGTDPYLRLKAMYGDHFWADAKVYEDLLHDIRQALARARELPAGDDLLPAADALRTFQDIVDRAGDSNVSLRAAAENVAEAGREYLLLVDDSLTPEDVADMSAAEARARIVDLLKQAEDAGDADAAYHRRHTLANLDGKIREFTYRNTDRKYFDMDLMDAFIEEDAYNPYPDDIDAFKGTPWADLLPPGDPPPSSVVDDIAGGPLRHVDDVADAADVTGTEHIYASLDDIWARKRQARGRDNPFVLDADGVYRGTTKLSDPDDAAGPFLSSAGMRAAPEGVSESDSAFRGALDLDLEQVVFEDPVHVTGQDPERVLLPDTAVSPAAVEEDLGLPAWLPDAPGDRPDLLGAAGDGVQDAPGTWSRPAEVDDVRPVLDGDGADWLASSEDAGAGVGSSTSDFRTGDDLSDYHGSDAWWEAEKRRRRHDTHSRMALVQELRQRLTDFVRKKIGALQPARRVAVEDDWIDWSEDVDDIRAVVDSLPGRELDGSVGDDLRAIENTLDAPPSEPRAGGSFHGGVVDDVEVPDTVSRFDIGDNADPPPSIVDRPASPNVVGDAVADPSLVGDAVADPPQGPYRGRLPESPDDFDLETAMNTRQTHWWPDDVRNDAVYPEIESAMTRAYVRVHEDAVGQARRFDPEFSGTRAVAAHQRLIELLDEATAAGDIEKASSIRTAVEELDARAHRTLYEGLLEVQNIYDNLPGLPSDVDSERVRSVIEARVQQAQEVFFRTGLSEDSDRATAWINAMGQLDDGRDPRSLLSGVRTEAIGGYMGSPPEQAAIFQDVADEIGRMFDLRYFQVDGEEAGSAFRFDDAVRQLQARAPVAEEMVAHNALLDTLDNIDIAARSCLLHADDSLAPDDVAGLSAVDARARLVQKMNQAAESGDVDTAHRAQRMLDLLDAKAEEFIERYEMLWVYAPEYEDLDEIRSRLRQSADVADDVAGRPLRDVGDAAGGEERSLDRYSDTARAPAEDALDRHRQWVAEELEKDFSSASPDVRTTEQGTFTLKLDGLEEPAGGKAGAVGGEDPGYASFRETVNDKVGAQDFARVPDEEPPGLASRGEVVADGDGARVLGMPETPPDVDVRVKKKRRLMGRRVTSKLEQWGGGRQAESGLQVLESVSVGDTMSRHLEYSDIIKDHVLTGRPLGNEDSWEIRGILFRISQDSFEVGQAPSSGDMSDIWKLAMGESYFKRGDDLLTKLGKGSHGPQRFNRKEQRLLDTVLELLKNDELARVGSAVQ